MAALHLTKVAVGCATLDILRERIAARAENEVARVMTRYTPKRADELIGGSLFWIIKHRLVARQEIVGFEQSEEKRCLIRLDRRLVSVRPIPRRAHQGWRYLGERDAPEDFDLGGADLAALPRELIEELAALSLI